jgi:hypothetical protein
MRTRSRTVALAGLLVSFVVFAAASPALAAPKKKKAAAAPAAEPAAPAKEKNVDDLMQESSTTKKKSAPSSSAGDESSSSSVDAEPVGEPDAWERPPKDEEKPKPAAAPKEPEKYGDGRRIEIGLAPGYGFKAGKADWSSTLNPYSLGLGIRGGYELDNRIFLGAGFVYHLGESETLVKNTPGAITPGSVDARQNYMLAFVEGGYDIWAGDLIIRPSLWLGMGFAIVDPYLNSGGVHTVSDFMFAPGLNLLYVMNGIYIGGDARYVAVTGDGVQGLDFFFMIGLRFK